MNIKIRPMYHLEPVYHKYICKCPTKCENYIDLDDYGRFCEKDAMDIAYRIINTVKKVKEPSKARGKGGSWKVSEEQYIVDWYAKGAEFGDIVVIAEYLGRSYGAVKSKIDRLRKEGRI